MALMTKPHLPALSNFREEMNRFFDTFWSEKWPAALGAGEGFIPPVELSESPAEYAIKVQVPGMARENLKIEVGDGYLYVSGEAKEEKEEKGQRWHRKEFQYGSFSRSVRLPGPVVMDKASARLDKGILAISIPKSEATKTQPRTITIV